MLLQARSHYMNQYWPRSMTPQWVNTLRSKQNGRHFPNDIFKCIFLNENVHVWISLQISLKFAPKVWINNIPALFQIMAWRLLGDKPLSEPMMVSKPLSEPMMVSLLMHIWVTRPQWVNGIFTFIHSLMHIVNNFLLFQNNLIFVIPDFSETFCLIVLSIT